MIIGAKVLIREQGKVIEVTVIGIGREHLKLQGESGCVYYRKFWEIARKHD